MARASQSDQHAGSSAAAAADSSAGASADAVVADLTAAAAPAAAAAEPAAAEAAAPAAAEPAAASAVDAASPSVAVPPPREGLPAALRRVAADSPVAFYAGAGLAAFLGLTFVVAVARTAARAFTPQAKRGRTVGKNAALVAELSKYLPGDRAGLTGGVVGSIRLRTGFSPVEIFRKFLWYLLRERSFDPDAVADVVALKRALGLRDADAAGALSERARRVYDKYGNVMLNTDGMSAEGVERKATARALFSKMLFLAECPEVVGPPAEGGADGGAPPPPAVDLRAVFGATEDDVARLRIASLYEVDLEAAAELPSAPGSEGSGGEE